MENRKRSFYERCLKRLVDFVCALCALIVLFPVLFLLTLIGAVAMKGNPFFTQRRPGKGERIFKLIKFRTMSNAKDKDGKLLPDDIRLNGYGRFLRATSLDELPELINILVGDMSIVGPRPQLVRDMVFMSDEQRRRHSIRQGLTGLAQVNGRNNISWEEKIAWDLKYIDDGITFWGDAKIVLKTVLKVFARADVATEGMETAEDYGDYLLRTGAISNEEFQEGQRRAMSLISAR